MRHVPVSQALPLTYHGPDSLGQGNDTIRSGERAAFRGLGHSIGNGTFLPVARIDIFIGQQSTHIKNHLDAKTSL